MKQLNTTTINFNGDLRMDPTFHKYTDTDEFVILKQCKSGLYLLEDKFGDNVTLAKKNINSL